MNVQGVRVCLISDHASPLATLGGVDAGGQNVYVAEVARGLARLGAQVDVLTRRDRPDLPSTVPLADGARVVHIDAGSAAPVAKEQLLEHMDAFADGALRVARRTSYDVVHANFFLSGLVAERLLDVLGLPFVVTFHALGRVRRREQGAADGFPDARFAIEDRLVARAARVIAECPQDRADLMDLYDAEPARLVVVPCGVDTDEMRPGDRAEARRRLGLPVDEPVVLQLGRLVARKGVDDVIRAMAVLRDDLGVSARLVVVGGSGRDPDPAADPDLARLMGQAGQSGVADIVTFIGRRDRDELADWYTAADLFVSAPWYEPFGITPLEAMACGIPVVGSAVGGISWTVRDGETGVLVPPRDPAAIAHAVGRLLADAPLRASMGETGVRWVRRRFTWDRVSAEIASVYRDVLGLGGGRGVRGSGRATTTTIPVAARAPAVQLTPVSRSAPPPGRDATRVTRAVPVGTRRLP